MTLPAIPLSEPAGTVTHVPWSDLDPEVLAVAIDALKAAVGELGLGPGPYELVFFDEPTGSPGVRPARAGFFQPEAPLIVHVARSATLADVAAVVRHEVWHLMRFETAGIDETSDAEEASARAFAAGARA